MGNTCFFRLTATDFTPQNQRATNGRPYSGLLTYAKKGTAFAVPFIICAYLK
jgi:hypothetical protein